MFHPRRHVVQQEYEVVVGIKCPKVAAQDAELRLQTRKPGVDLGVGVLRVVWQGAVQVRGEGGDGAEMGQRAVVSLVASPRIA